MTIKEIKSLNHYFYYLNGRLIKSTQQQSQLPIELFDSDFQKTDSQFQVYFEKGVYRLNGNNKSLNKYNGVYKFEIYSLLNHYDYVSRNQLKEQFVGNNDLYKERLQRVGDVTFLTSISTEQKIETFSKLFKKYNLKMLKTDSSFKSIPIPSLLSDDLIVAENGKEVRLQHYFMSLEHHLNMFSKNERWIVVDSFDLLNQKFADYFATKLLKNVDNEQLNLELFSGRLPDDLKEPTFLYANNLFGYFGCLKKTDASHITSMRFGTSKNSLKECLCKELFARYVQNKNISPVQKSKEFATSIDIFNLENLSEVGVFLFCFGLGKE